MCTMGSAGGDVGEASKWLTIMQLPRTNGNLRVWRESLGQPAVASGGNRPILGTYGRTASQSSWKHHPLQGRRRFVEDALMPADPRIRPTMIRRVMQSNRRWVPRSRSPMDSKCHEGSPANDVVKQRTDPGRRSADPPQGTSVHVMGTSRDLNSRPRPPQSQVEEAFRKVVHQSEPNRPKSPLMLMQRTKSWLGLQAGQSRRVQLHQNSAAPGWEEDSKDDPEPSPRGAQDPGRV